jgi:hypothetical protein
MSSVERIKLELITIIIRGTEYDLYMWKWGVTNNDSSIEIVFLISFCNVPLIFA